jgi:fatty-acyl-CoA synthase
MFAALETLRPLVRSARALAVMTPRLPGAALGGVPGAVRAVARRRPHGPALRTLVGTLTWAELDREADRRAAFWRAQGLNPGDAVALLLGNRAETLLQQLGIARMGGVAALVDHALSGAGLEHVLGAARVRGAVVDTTGAASLETLRFRGALGVWGVDDETGPPAGTRDLLAALPSAAPSPPSGALVGPDDVFAYVFTSGTTGLPKAARIRHHRWLMAGGGVSGVRALVETDGRGVHAAAAAPFVGADGRLLGGPRRGVLFRRRAPVQRVALLGAGPALGATVGLYVGETLRYLVNRPASADERDHGLRLFVGNGLRADVWTQAQSRFGVERIVEFYGATEGNHLLVNRDGKVGSCGRLLPIFRGPLDGLELVRFDVAAEARSGARTGVACGARRVRRGNSSVASPACPPSASTATPIRPRRKRRSCAMCFSREIHGSARAICCAATPTETSSSSTALVTRSAGRARTSARRPSPRR